MKHPDSHCIHGHELLLDTRNLAFTSQGQYRCRVCSRIARRKWYAIHHAADSHIRVQALRAKADELEQKAIIQEGTYA